MFNNPKYENYIFSIIKTVQEKLTKKKIDSLTRKDIEEVTDCLHCMNSVQIGKHKFLNTINNDDEVIKNQWKNLLHNGKMGLEDRMATCDRNLKYFSKSSIRELIAWYFPEQYPIVNVNSNSGMKFFGYDIKTY